MFTLYITKAVCWAGMAQSVQRLSYGLEGRVIEILWRQDFPLSSRPAVGPNHPPVQWIPDLFPGGKTAVAWRSQPTPSSAEVKETIDLIPLWAFMVCSSVNWVPDLFCPGKQPGCGADHPPSSSAEVKEVVELYRTHQYLLNMLGYMFRLS
jgi:hypothetical protein